MIIDEDIETLLYSEKETDNVEDSDNINIPIHFYGFEDQIETSFNIKQTNNQQTENIARSSNINDDANANESKNFDHMTQTEVIIGENASQNTTISQPLLPNISEEKVEEEDDDDDNEAKVQGKDDDDDNEAKVKQKDDDDVPFYIH